MTTDLRPPPEVDIPPRRVAQRRAHLLSEIVPANAARNRRRLRRRVTWVVVPAVLLAGTAFSYLALRPADQIVNGIGCFDAPTANSNTAIVEGDGRHPVEICAELWEEGSVGPYPFTPQPAPPLVACVPPFDVVWVFPGQGEDFCDSMGLTDLPPGFVEASRRYASMRDDLERQLGREEGNWGCTREAEATRIAREVLDQHGFDDWTIEVGSGEHGQGFSPDRPCAGLSFDAEASIVHLVPEEHLQR